MPDPLDLKSRPADADEEALPLPFGIPLYESLTSKFIAFDRLLQTLGELGASGYVRLVAPNTNGIVLLRNGKAVDCLHREGGRLQRGEAALTAIRRLVDDGAGVLDVVSLDSELIDGLHHLASGEAMYPPLYASWVKGDGLLDFLRAQGFTGCLSVRAAAGGGVVMLNRGEVTGAFTTESRALGRDAGEVLALCVDPEAAIEVHGASSSSDVITRQSPVESAFSELVT